MRVPKDFPLTEEQLSQLAGYGICLIHTHPKEDLGFSDILELMLAAPVTEVNTSPYSPTSKDMILLVDTTAGSITINMPIAAKGREFYIVKTAGNFPVYVVPFSGEEILNSGSGVSFTNIGTSIRLKAFLNVGYWLL